jgi:hypothetical protein
MESPKTEGFFQDKIARLLIAGAFVLIAIILAIHFYSTQFLLDSFKASSTTHNAADFTNFYRDVTSANINIFGIILSLFGAWIGAVLAFYFGSQSLNTLRSSLNQAQQSINTLASDSKLSKLTLKQVIEKNPESMRLNKFKMDSKISDIMKTVGDIFTFVVITDNSEKKPLGLLFISDLTKAKSKDELKGLDKSLKDYLNENDITDFITTKKWTTDGVTNFALANISDSLKDVVNRMNEIGPSLSVRAIVVENDSIKAIMGHDLISKEIEKA